MTQAAPHQLAETWEVAAEDYERHFVPFSDRVAEAVLGFAQPRARERFLDVAAGTGAVTVRAAALGVRVSAVDFSPAMLAILHRKLESRGLEAEATRLMDGESLAFGDGEFDAVGSSFGVVHFPHPDRGLSEMRRVLARGGRAFVTSTGHAGSSKLLRLIAETLGAAGHRPGFGSVAQHLPDPEQMSSRMREAGFADVRVETIVVPWPISNAAEFWDAWVLGSPLSAGAMRGLDARIKAAAKEAFSQRAGAEAGPEGFETEVVLGMGRKK
jgi:ubiquinone/menaquinone biosynthesis C-methylase UbiE